MTKLFKLKEWLTLSDAARHLSSIFSEEVTVADVLRFALDGHLRLSVRFVNGAIGYSGKVVPIAEAEFQEVPSLDGKRKLRLYKGPTLWQGDIESHVVELERTLLSLDGVYDLPLIGAERLDVENVYQELTDGPPVTRVNLDGAFVQGREETLCQLQENSISGSGEYHPARLPKDHVLVVRPAALTEFQQTINNDQEKPLLTKERNTLLCIIAVLCHEAKVDFNKAAKAAGHIQRIADELGIQIGETTIENHLNRILDALGGRKK